MLIMHGLNMIRHVQLFSIMKIVQDINFIKMSRLVVLAGILLSLKQVAKGKLIEYLCM